MSRVLLTIITISFSITGFGQINLPNFGEKPKYNFVPNPGFEVTNYIPCKWNQGIGKFDKWMASWTSPTHTTPDLLTEAADENCWTHPSKNSFGKNSPHSGLNMVGIKTFGTGGTDTYWHEYVQIKLEEPLKKDTVYYAEFWVNCSGRASKVTNNIGMAFSNDEIKRNSRFPLYISPRINADEIIKPRRIMDWRKISGVFQALGGEAYVLIGNFYGDEYTLMERLPEGKDGAYYYIDDVFVRRAASGEKVTSPPPRSIPPPPLIAVDERISTQEIELKQVEYKQGTVVTLNNIFFEFAKAELLPESETELNRLVDLLFDYPLMEIEISGHTDNVGTDEFNLKLSEARAKAVSDYLINHETEKDRISYKGYGESKPIADNETDVGRQMNRRVEFKIIRND